MSGAGEGASALWLAVSDEVVAGIHHALNNRAGALAAVAQVLEADIGAEHPLRAALAYEVERLQATVRALTWLPRRAAGQAEPVQLSDLLPAVVELYGYHHQVRDTPCTVQDAAAAAPLRVEPALLAHVLLVLMIAAGGVASEAGTEVRVSCGGTAEAVEIVVEAAGVQPEAPGGGDADAVGALDAWVRAMGGTLSGGGARWTLRLPSLAEVRRREREGLG